MADQPLNELEKDALREIINIALGRAAAELHEIINLYVFMNIPQLEVLNPSEIEDFINCELTGVNLVEQYFIGKTKGIAYLMLPERSGRQLLHLLGAEQCDTNTYGGDLLEQEALMEIGNIVIGACVGKISDLMGDVVSYLPPRILTCGTDRTPLPQKLFAGENYVIMLKTVFHFEGKDIDGFLFLVNSYDSINWLKQSIDDFIAQYL